MATFDQVKELLCKVLRNRNNEDSDGDIIFEAHSFGERYRRLVISNSELHELYDKVSSMTTNGLKLYTDNYYEVAMDLDLDRYIMRRQEILFTSKDTINGVDYELGYPSVEYSMYLLMLLTDRINQQKLKTTTVQAMRLRRPLERHFIDEEELSLNEALPKMVGVISLKIKMSNQILGILFRDLKSAFEFEFMYKTGKALVEFLDIDEIFPMPHGMPRKIDATQIDTPPLRKYSGDVVDYYKQALASNDPYIKFISFYHVMEYFYDEVFKRKLVTDLRNKITHPDFSYKDEEKIYDIALFVKNRLHTNNETGQGDELESLKYVLQEYIFIDDLKRRINAIDRTALNYYQNNKVSFCNAPIIGWSDSQGVYTQIAKRIYFTRNSLVHSKSGKNKERYRPYKDEKQLQLEIPFVRAVAEAIIINASEII